MSGSARHVVKQFGESDLNIVCILNFSILYQEWVEWSMCIVSFF